MEWISLLFHIWPEGNSAEIVTHSWCRSHTQKKKKEKKAFLRQLPLLLLLFIFVENIFLTRLNISHFLSFKVRQSTNYMLLKCPNIVRKDRLGGLLHVCIFRRRLQRQQQHEPTAVENISGGENMLFEMKQAAVREYMIVTTSCYTRTTTFLG